MSQENRQILLQSNPQGKLAVEHFRQGAGPIPTPGPGQVLLRTLMLSLDAANRAWMQGATYRSAVEAGQVMAGGAIAEIVESNDPAFAVGERVFADTGWQDYAAVAGDKLFKLPDIEPISHLLSVYGVAGLTAYFGLLRYGEPRPGETVVVSAAGGSVGSLVGQIAKIQGCRVVGIAGGADKCALLQRELGFDAVVDYKAPQFKKALIEACPKGIDVYFDNVGGPVFEACLFGMNLRGRIACCGAVSAYDGTPPTAGPRGVPGLIVTKRLTVRGFIVMDHYGERDQAIAQMRQWVQSGQLKVREDIVDGLENAPAALVGLLAGENIGKRMVRVR
ncbi:MAG: NADP-dependent oxidoreductase [Burkholderiaceae bacterium]